MRNIAKRIIDIFYKNDWNEIEFFDSQWKFRIKLMSKYINRSDAVADFGCGKMWLKEYLCHDNIYIPIDYKDRGEGTVICDFNKYEFPEINADISFISGCLEYIKDYDWFAGKLSTCSNRVVLSYCTSDYFPNMRIRSKNAWENNLSKADLIRAFNKYGFVLIEEDITQTKNSIFYFEKKS